MNKMEKYETIRKRNGFLKDIMRYIRIRKWFEKQRETKWNRLKNEKKVKTKGKKQVGNKASQ